MLVAAVVAEGMDTGDGEVKERMESPLEEVFGKMGTKLVPPCGRVVRANPVSEAASGIKET